MMTDHTATNLTYVTVRTVCQATVFEKWTLALTPEQMDVLTNNPEAALALLDSESIIAVENEEVTDEGDRILRSVTVEKRARA